MDKHIEELKKVALKATQGRWVAFSNIKTGTFAVHTPGDTRCGDIVNWQGFDCNSSSNRQSSYNAKFIAAANPSVVLALLAKLEAAEIVNSDVIRDANRYRFLRDEDSWGEDSNSWDVETRTGLISSENLMELRLDHFDAAIDARMAASDIPFLNPVTSALSAEDSQWKQRAEAAEARLLVPVKLSKPYTQSDTDRLGLERMDAYGLAYGSEKTLSAATMAIKAAGYPVEGGE
ncbi:Uncharacterised protein [Yersinia rohdei]|uniref:Ead/Ea22-like family protein n=4 Tax=Yersinia rohdei TaxID=29485 RepID=A0A0U1HQX5_YERRO|nr:Uncharacterised protein [Yersinia rohdei]